MAIAKFFEFKQGSKILDVGTGGGLPGIPLAILFPKVQFTLIDRIAKKITVANNIINELGLTNVTARQQTVEENKEKYDYIVSRAVTAFPDFYKLVKKNVSINKTGFLINIAGEVKDTIAHIITERILNVICSFSINHHNALSGFNHTHQLLTLNSIA
jgi:16S rRNA (guanine(527)-N(7))-methyltransferase RsmG